MNDNKLIAEFMGYKVGERRRGGGYIPENEIKYDTSWDSLMPVLIKIEKIEIGGGTWTSVYFDIEREYKKAVEFIKEYNNERQ